MNVDPSLSLLLSIASGPADLSRSFTAVSKPIRKKKKSKGSDVTKTQREERNIKEK